MKNPESDSNKINPITIMIFFSAGTIVGEVSGIRDAVQRTLQKYKAPVTTTVVSDESPDESHSSPVLYGGAEY